MRKLIDETDAFFKVASLLTVIEDRFSFVMPDPKDDVKDWGKLTLDDLVRIGCDSNPTVAVSQMAEAVKTAIRSEFPQAPEPLNFTVPVLDALLATREYRGY